MSDIHIDYDYLPGADNDCGMPLCCRSDSGMAPTKERAAGKWGDYRCDMNSLTLASMFEYISKEVKPDVVLWGGDSIPHNVDSLTLQTNVDIMKNITKDVKEGLAGIKIYPAIGNHDTYPQDIIQMAIPRQNEAINEWAPKWKEWLDIDAQQWENFKNWGYYSLPFVGFDGQPLGNANTKIISLNNNICYRFNWVSMEVASDPGNMLGWLEQELTDIEASNGTAIIMSHVPNLDECNPEFGRRYHALMDRF